MTASFFSDAEPRVGVRDACLARPLRCAPGAAPRSGGDARVADEPVKASRVPAVLAEHILFTSDGSETAMEAAPFVSMAVAACEPRRVTVLRVLTPADAGGGPGHQVHALDWAMARAQAEAGLGRVVSKLTLPEEQVKPVVTEGRAAEQILQFAELEQVDLLVIASHGRDDARPWRMGATVRKVTADGRVSVLVVPMDPLPTWPIRTIAVPLDCSARAEQVLPLASRIAATADAEIVLVHVVPEPELPHRLPTAARDRKLAEELTQLNRARAESYLRGLEQRLEAQGVRARTQLLSNTNPARGLHAWLELGAADLVLVSAHGAGARGDEAYGSVVQRLLNRVPMPLWVVQDLPPLREPCVVRGSGGSPERA